MSGVNLICAVSGNYCRSEITINRGNKDENKELFEFLFNLKERVEKDFGAKLTWERMNDNVTSRIKYQQNGVSYFEEDDWPTMNKFLVDVASRMENAFREPIRELNLYAKNK